jgi:hypothetical protein
MISLHTFFQLRKGKKQALEFVILALSMFYLFNLQRGIVRHSFIEGNETQILSFAWLIILLKVVQLFDSKTKTLSLLAIGCSIAALFFSIGKLNGTLPILQREKQFNLSEIPKLSHSPINRIKKNDAFDNQNAPLFDFIQKNLKNDETFIDFSNTPLTYFYTGKNIPSYFNQYLQNTVTDELLDENIQSLNLQKIPLVIFSQSPETYFDHTDNIPNKIRYHKLTRVIYKHYKPFTTIGNYRLWKRKNWNPSTKIHPEYVVHFEDWNLGLIPFYWKANKGDQFVKSNSNSTCTFNKDKNEFIWKNNIHAEDFLQLIIKSEQEQMFILEAKDFKLQFKVKAGSNTYSIPLGISEQIKAQSIHQLQLKSEQSFTLHQYRFVSLHSK